MTKNLFPEGSLWLNQELCIHSCIDYYFALEESVKHWSLKLTWLCDGGVSVVFLSDPFL